MLALLLLLIQDPEWISHPLAPEHGDVARWDDYGIVRVSVLEAIRLGAHEVAVERRGDALAVDCDGDGAPETEIPPEGGVATLSFGYQVRLESVPVFRAGRNPTREWLYRCDTVLRGDGPEGPVTLVDANGNGLFGDAGEDFLIPRGGRAPLLFAAEMALGGRRYRLRVAEDGAALESQDAGDADRRRAETGICRTINEWRARAGLAPVYEDRDLTGACARHARYLAAHESDLDHVSPHTELEEYRDYTPEGARAAMDSYIGFGHRSLEEFFLGNQQTFYHRINYYSPALQTVGFTQSGRISMIDAGSCSRATWPARAHPVVLPLDGSTDVAQTFTRESPDPTQNGRSAESYGMPIQAVFPSTARLADVRLTVETSSGRAVEGRLNGPTQSLIEDFRMPNVVGILPERPLFPAQAYTAVVECTWDGRPYRRIWTFTTAGRP